VSISLISEQLEKLLPEIRALLAAPSLEVHINDAWSANQKQSRLLLRQAVIDQIEKKTRLSDVERETLLRLEFLPNPPEVSVSISHTPSLGGFALTYAHSPAVGFDIEESQRVHAKAVARVSKPEELLAAPSPAHLWVAKEAAFKALRGRPKVLSALTTGAWRSVVSKENLSLWSCDVREDSLPNGTTTGLSVELYGTAFAIFLA
jgi:phosphopantetheinyl transferase